MYLYKPEMYDKFRFKFKGLENIQTSYSQCLQDMFVLAALNGRKNGTFLEIGAYHSKFISNTYLLESQFGWNGVSVDIDSYAATTFQNERTAKFYHHDALTLDYQRIIFNDFKSNRIDYLSLDIEPSTNTLQCLKNLPLTHCRFSVITYETDYYDTATPKEVNERVREDSRSILKSHGYVLVSGNLSNLDAEHPFEDWYLDGEFFFSKWIQKFKRNDDDPMAAHVYMGLE